MRKKKIALLLLLFPPISLLAQQTSFLFDFGSDATAKGYIRITPGTKFNYKIVYGFDQPSEVESVERGNNALTGDFITSKKPFYFSVKLPDGNYNRQTTEIASSKWNGNYKHQFTKAGSCIIKIGLV